MVADCAMISGFTFQWPAVLALLLLIFPLWWLLAYARLQRLELMDAVGVGGQTHRRLLDALRICAFILLVLALARPGHSPSRQSFSRSGRDVVFALDVSRSMLAEDVSPNRLEVAKQAIRDALQVMDNERVALVVYAGSASILCPLTYDYGFVRYMLEQADPHSVDFGGTTLQSAVEKVVDQVFIDGREGVQDLVVLTDGGDHGSQMSKVVELLESKQADVLIIGLGDPNQAAPIPIRNDNAEVTQLEYDGKVVYTKLDDAALRAFAMKSSHAHYLAIGLRPFNLGQLYLDHAADKETKATDQQVGIVVYQEAAMWFLLPALLLLLLTECRVVNLLGVRWGALCLILCAIMPERAVASSGFRTEFDVAVGLMSKGRYDEAEVQFASLYLSAPHSMLQAGDLAALQYNRGLCLAELSKAQAELSAVIALGYAQQAQAAFLSAKRYAPTMSRAGVSLESAAEWLLVLQRKIEQQEQADRELNAQMAALIEHLQGLLDEQRELRTACQAVDIDRRRPRRSRHAGPPPPIVAPVNSIENAKRFFDLQAGLVDEAKKIEVLMQEIDIKLAGSTADVSALVTLMTEPLNLIVQVQQTQEKALQYLSSWNSWPAARASQQIVEGLVGRILELLSGNSQQEQAEEGEMYEDYEDGYDYEYMDDAGQSIMDSQAAQADLAAGLEMQQLPIPNYTAEDILSEEQESMQFRQQKRLSANAGKIDKDY